MLPSAIYLCIGRWRIACKNSSLHLFFPVEIARPVSICRGIQIRHQTILKIMKQVKSCSGGHSSKESNKLRGETISMGFREPLIAGAVLFPLLKTGAVTPVTRITNTLSVGLFS